MSENENTMVRDPLKDGTHDWDIIHQYHRCENCGTIIESREGYELRHKQFEKDLKCKSCGHAFTVTAAKKSSFGPLFGKQQP